MNILLKEQLEKGANQTIVNELRISLQYFVATLMDN
jgi:DNA-directed RNA polymerase beta' subunit